MFTKWFSSNYVTSYGFWFSFFDLLEVAPLDLAPKEREPDPREILDDKIDVAAY